MTLFKCVNLVHEGGTFMDFASHLYSDKEREEWERKRVETEELNSQSAMLDRLRAMKQRFE